MCNFTKEEAIKFKEITYIRVLGFNDKGKIYLNTIKKNSTISIVTNPKNSNDEMLKLEHRVTNIYNIVTGSNLKDQLEKPIIN